MEKAGFVERRPDPDDQRVSRAYLTEAGRSVREAVEDSMRQLEAEAFVGFSQEERDRFRRLLQRLLANLDREAEPCPSPSANP
jgi:DNA-binding MarR family transcriptional regulator